MDYIKCDFCSRIIDKAYSYEIYLENIDNIQLCRECVDHIKREYLIKPLEPAKYPCIFKSNNRFKYYTNFSDINKKDIDDQSEYGIIWMDDIKPKIIESFLGKNNYGSMTIEDIDKLYNMPYIVREYTNTKIYIGFRDHQVTQPIIGEISTAESYIALSFNISDISKKDLLSKLNQYIVDNKLKDNACYLVTDRSDYKLDDLHYLCNPELYLNITWYQTLEDLKDELYNPINCDSESQFYATKEFIELQLIYYNNKIIKINDKLQKYKDALDIVNYY